VSLTPFLHLDASLADVVTGDTVPLDAGARHHLTRVLRLADGAEVEVSDGRGARAAGEVTGGGIRVTGEVLVVPRPAPSMTVLQGLPRGRKLDEVLRQITELGADRLVPVAATRSVARLEGARAEKAVERWRGVARAAAEQSRRAWRPEVAEVATVSAVGQGLPERTQLLVAHVGASRSLPEVVGAGQTGDVAVAVGPEGGWSDAEVDLLRAAGGIPVGLGPTVLRTGHAAAAAVAVLGALSGRWG
jgi:16S rRNA (uracil1498-N3)-methyltransferase